MEFTEVVTGRRSIRQYTEQSVTEQEIEEILTLCRYAPTWKNSQTVRYHVILNEELKNKIAKECTMQFSKNKQNIQNAAGLVILTTKDNISGYEKDGTATTSKGSHWQSFDAGIACQTFCLTAYDKGFGTLIMGIYDESKVKEMLSLPENESVSALIAIGHAEQNPQAPERKPLQDVMKLY